MKNPLRRRILRELAGDWQKYAVVLLFMVFMIGVVSGMYVGHDSMLAAVDKTRAESNLEDGRFELEKKADAALLRKIGSGEMADVRAWLLDKGYEEAEKEVAKKAEEELEKQVKDQIGAAVRAQCAAFGITNEAAVQKQIDAALSANYETALAAARDSQEYKDALAEANEEARKEVEKEVDEEQRDIEKDYDLNDPDFTPRKVTILENFYRNEEEDQDGDGEKDATIRVYRSDAEADLASFNEGRAPENENEIAIDRMHAANVGVSVGDTILVGKRAFEVVGLLSYSNYLTLHESNNDMMFDAFGFDVGMVTPEGFARLKTPVHWNYAFFYEEKPDGDLEKADWSEDFLKALITQTVTAEAELEDYVPVYLNQAVNFAPDDIEGDTAATGILVYILIAVIAFIFAVTISSTIDKEATVIGTLRASGYTKSELVRHYMAAPVIVTILGAILGNLIGYTWFKDVAVGLYYNSYSLPKYTTVWSSSAMIRTTVIPLVLMFFINLFVITQKLRLSPLSFLRRDLKKAKRTKARRLPDWGFLRRFRMRILLQNVPNYIILIVGVVLVEVMLCFAFGLPDSLDHYSKTAPDMLFTKYQYVLTDMEDEDGKVIETKEADAERFSSTQLQQPKQKGIAIRGTGGGSDESVTVYGFATNSRYIDAPDSLQGHEVYISSAYAEKYRLAEGDTLTLHEKYENKSYTFDVAGIFEYDGGVAAFLPNDNFNRIFDREEGAFNGYFSDKELTDLPEEQVATVITAEDITKIATQLQHSMGGFMKMFQYVLFVLAVILIYLLTKLIIEKNENAISMAKILGFRNREIASLYMVPTALIVFVFTFGSFVAGYLIIEQLFRMFMMQMDGWFKYYMSPKGIVLAILFMLIGYAIVSLIDYRRIRRIPMDEALKSVD